MNRLPFTAAQRINACHSHGGCDHTNAVFAHEDGKCTGRSPQNESSALLLPEDLRADDQKRSLHHKQQHADGAGCVFQHSGGIGGIRGQKRIARKHRPDQRRRHFQPLQHAKQLRQNPRKRDHLQKRDHEKAEMRTAKPVAQLHK